MDRKNFFLGMACIVGAFALFFLTKPATPPPGATPAPSAAVAPVVPALVAKPATTLPASVQSARPVPVEAAKSFVLENEKLKVTLTNRGGAIREIRLKKEFADVTKQGVVVFNAGNDESALALAVKNPVTGKLETLLSEFVAQPGATADTITLVGGLADGTRIERSFTLTAKEGAAVEPYSLGFVTKVIPPAGKPAADDHDVVFHRFAFNVLHRRSRAKVCRDCPGFPSREDSICRCAIIAALQERAIRCVPISRRRSRWSPAPAAAWASASRACWPPRTRRPAARSISARPFSLSAAGSSPDSGVSRPWPPSPRPH
jgi:hypothetical protein